MWTLDKIKKYIEDGVEENIHLDYKGAGSLAKSTEKKKEISKDVSAFANSDGGTIIYGVKEFDDLDKNHIPEKIDPINGKDFSKERLEQIINSTISPTIQNIRITPIQTGDKEHNLVIYVVEIPKSNTAHQMNDKRYYKRYNFQSIAMEDWEIKDIINRLARTQVKLSFEYNPSIITEHTKTITISIWVHNIGSKVIKYLDCIVYGDPCAAENISKPFCDNFSPVDIHFSNLIVNKVTIDNNTFETNSYREVILPNIKCKIGHLEIKKEFVKEDNKLTFQISTEDNVEYIPFNGKEIY
ncbi:ATP-binding protein [Rapidithrix thailandica]|uniref:ATP-binding protein n=1 Tax=Rapidithrix thailandica TaxID=413964 RepID=A0AAW9S8L2_9BACT